MFLKGIHKYTNASPKEGKVELNDMTYIMGLQAGYMHYLMNSKVVLGIELGFSIPGLNATKNLQIDGSPVEGRVTIRHRYKFGFALFSGVVLNPKVMMYGKLGIESNKFDLNYTKLTFQTPNHERYSVSLRGLVPGAGVYYKLTQSLLIGAEYNYSFMKKVQPRVDTVTLNGANRGYSFSPIQHRLIVKITQIF